MKTISAHTLVETDLLPEPAVVEPVDPLLREELLALVEERGQVTVRCHLRSPYPTCARIWPSTYLICHRTGYRSKLMHAEGISFMPVWMPIPSGTTSFILVFEPLPAECVLFDMVEEIPEPGGFQVRCIARNGRDLYDALV